jgi:hypothetical protein
MTQLAWLPHNKFLVRHEELVGNTMKRKRGKHNSSLALRAGTDVSILTAWGNDGRHNLMRRISRYSSPRARVISFNSALFTLFATLFPLFLSVFDNQL